VGRGVDRGNWRAQLKSAENFKIIYDLAHAWMRGGASRAACDAVISSYANRLVTGRRDAVAYIAMRRERGFSTWPACAAVGASWRSTPIRKRRFSRLPIMA